MKRAIHLLLFLCVCTLAWGDGAMFMGQAKLADPTIPFQRAFIRHDGTEQTLIVASTAQVDGATDLVWVLPVPNPPTQMAPVRPNVFEPLEALTQPEFNLPPNPQDLSRLLLCGGFVAIMILVAPFVADGSARKWRAFAGCVAAGFAVAVMFWYGVPGAKTDAATGSAGTAEDAVVEVLQSAEVGNYKVEVVRGTTAQTAEWMTANGFRLSDEAKSAVDGYTKDGWVFLMAKLKSEAKGFLTPHPIKVVFESPKPVYPMRLTGAMGATVAVELFIASDGYATAPLSQIVQTAPVEMQDSKVPVVPFRANLDSPLRGQVTHQDLVDVLQDSDKITRLRATVTPGDMNRDWEISLHSGEVENVKVDTFESAVFKAVRTGLAAGILILLAGAWFVVQSQRHPTWVGLALLVALAGGGGIGMMALRANPGFLSSTWGALPDDGLGRVEYTLYDLERPDAAELEKAGSLKKYLSQDKNFAKLYFDGPSESLPDERVGIYEMQGGARAVVRDRFGATYIFRFPGVKP